jgi:hypothetical protein
MLNNSINNIMFELRGPVVSAHCVHTCMDMHNRNSVRLPCSAFVGRSTNSNAVPGTVQWESPSDATTRSTYLVSLPTKQIGGKTGHNTPNKLKIGGKPGHNFISTGQQDANEKTRRKSMKLSSMFSQNSSTVAPKHTRKRKAPCSAADDASNKEDEDREKQSVPAGHAHCKSCKKDKTED